MPAERAVLPTSRGADFRVEMASRLHCRERPRITRRVIPTVKTIGKYLLLALGILLAVLLIKRFLPHGWTSAQHLGDLLRSLHARPIGPLYVCGAFALLASAFVPVMALITASAMVFHPALAFAYAFSGSLLSAALSRAAGQLISGPVLRRMQGPRLSKLRERLHTHTFSATVAARILPLGNFAAINLLAGAVKVPWLPYMLGNAAGMVFGIAAFTLLADRLKRIIAAPTPVNVGIAVVSLIALVLLGVVISRFVQRRADPSR